MWSLFRSSFTWKYGRRGSRGENNGRKRVVVLGKVFIYIEMWRERFQRKKEVLKAGWTLVGGSVQFSHMTDWIVRGTWQRIQQRFSSVFSCGRPLRAVLPRADVDVVHPAFPLPTRGSFTWTRLKRGMAFVQGFIHLETWRERFQRKVVSKEVKSLFRGSFIWKHEGEGSGEKWS